MGCHMMDGAYWALGLTQPTSVEAASSVQTDVTGPKVSVVTYEFPARGRMPAVTWKWYDGGLMPPLPPDLEPNRVLPDNGTLIVGRKATVLAHPNYLSVRVVPEMRMQERLPALPPQNAAAGRRRSLGGVGRGLQGRAAGGREFSVCGAADRVGVVELGRGACAPENSLGGDGDAGHEFCGSQPMGDESVSSRLRRVKRPGECFSFWPAPRRAG